MAYAINVPSQLALVHAVCVCIYTVCKLKTDGGKREDKHNTLQLVVQ